jgi:hypothetical protein
MTAGLVQTYLEYWRTKREDLFWAWDEVFDLVMDSQHESLAGRARADSIVPVLRSAVENDARLRQALRGVWESQQDEAGRVG